MSESEVWKRVYAVNSRTPVTGVLTQSDREQVAERQEILESYDAPEWTGTFELNVPPRVEDGNDLVLVVSPDNRKFGYHSHTGFMETRPVRGNGQATAIFGSMLVKYVLEEMKDMGEKQVRPVIHEDDINAWEAAKRCYLNR